MKKIMFLTLLVINTLSAYAAQTTPVCTLCSKHIELPIELQLQKAEAELARAQYEQKKGPDIHIKDLVLPGIGMFLGGIWTLASTSKLFAGEFKTPEVSGCALGAMTFLLSYMKFNNSNPEGTVVLEQTVEAKKNTVDYLRQVAEKASNEKKQ